MRDDELFFIVGVGRSGTTLLMSMLNAHPDIGTPPETHFLTQHVLPQRELSFSQLRERLAADSRFGRLGLNLSDVLEPFEDGETPLALRSVYFRWLDLWRSRSGVRLVGDKAPRYVEFLPLLKWVAPNARVIHLIRDPRSVFLSRTKAAWSADRQAWRHLVAYCVQYSEGRTRGPALFGERYHEVRYESLITHPEAVLSEVAEFLGVAYDPAMLNFSESAAGIITEDEWDWKREAAGPLLRDNADKWKRELSSAQIGLIERACRQPFKDGLYDASSNTPSFGGRLTAALVRIGSAVYRGALRRRASAFGASD